MNGERAFEGEPHTGIAVMAMVNAADAKRLAVRDGEPASELHVTITCLSQDAATVSFPTRALLQAKLKGMLEEIQLPLEIDAFARAQFNWANSPDSDNPPATVLLVQSTSLMTLKEDVEFCLATTREIDQDNTFPSWVPHITLGYNMNLNRVTEAMAGPVQLDRLVVSWGSQVIDLTHCAPLGRAD